MTFSRRESFYEIIKGHDHRPTFAFRESEKDSKTGREGEQEKEREEKNCGLPKSQ